MEPRNNSEEINLLYENLVTIKFQNFPGSSKPVENSVFLFSFPGRWDVFLWNVVHPYLKNNDIYTNVKW